MVAGLRHPAESRNTFQPRRHTRATSRRRVCLWPVLGGRVLGPKARETYGIKSKGEAFFLRTCWYDLLLIDSTLISRVLF